METLEHWSEFGVAMAGVTGALAGLLIVAMSVNIEVIVASKSLPARAGASIATLVLTVVVSCLLLVPGIDGVGYGIAVLACTAVAWLFQIDAIVKIVKYVQAGTRSRVGVVLSGALPLIAFSIGGVLVLVGVAGGMMAIVAACLLAIASSVLISWVTLVEVRR